MKKARPKLSICIPTYNFGTTLGATLDSIIDQYVEDVEIVVLDSASTDDTADVVTQRAKRCDNLRYIRADARGGIDADMAHVAALASGQMVWLFSADDLMRPGALARVTAMVAEDPADVFLLSHSNCTFDMQVLVPRHPVLTGPSRRISVTGPASRAEYFAAGETTEAFFSYMSGLVVRRSTWDALSNAKMFVGSCWSHAARLMAGMARGGLTVSYVADVLVDRRGDNDSFAEHGLVQRYALAIDGYIAIGEQLFGEGSVEVANIRRVLRREFGLIMFMIARRRCSAEPEREDRQRLDVLFARIYADDPRGWYRRPLYRFLPPRTSLAMLAIARRLYRSIR